MSIKTICYLLFISAFLVGCGGSSSSSSSSSASLTDSYSSQIEGSNITVDGKELSGYSVSMTYYPPSTFFARGMQNEPSYSFVVYINQKSLDVHTEKTSGFGIASTLPKFTERYKDYATGAADDDEYGLDRSDYLVLITISGGVFSDGTPLRGRLYTIIQESYLKRGDRPKINELGTYAVMRVLRSGVSSKDDVLDILEAIAENYFNIDPLTKEEANFSSFNNFDPKDRSSLRDIFVYEELISNIKDALISGDTARLNSVFEDDKDGDGVMAAAGECTDSNYQLEGYKGRDCYDNRDDIYNYMPTDKDGDFIPDDVERMLGISAEKWDKNSNGIADGIDSSFDPYYKNQWHLRSTGIVTNNTNNVKTIIGNDLDLLEVHRSYMGYNGGSYIGVQIVDSGIEAAHEDLSPNMDLSLSRNVKNGSNNPTPVTVVDESSEETDPLSVGHGSACAGIIAARGFNDIGVRGVAPFAKISGSNWLENADNDALAEIWLIDDVGQPTIVVSNNSWGNIRGNSSYDEILTVSTLLDRGATLRGGKGRVYVFAAGNSRNTKIDGDTIKADANMDATSSHRYSVAVAALDYDNSYAPYSNPGANIWLSGYAGSWYSQTPTIATTLLTGKSKRVDIDEIGENSAPTFYNDTSRSYTFAMNGTSAAAPTVSGAIALILEACPNLTQRDVKYLSATTAKKVDSRNSSWITNKAGIKHSRDYGFGLINTKAVIDRCKSGYVNLGKDDSASVVREEIEVVVPANSETIQEFSIDKNLKIEYIYIWHDIDITSTGSDALDIELTSPSGTVMPIIKNLVDSEVDFRGGMRFGVAGFLDESSSGVWKLSVKNRSQSRDISFERIGIEIFGR